MGANLVAAALLRIVTLAVALVMIGLIYSAVLKPDLRHFETKLLPHVPYIHQAQLDTRRWQ
jgi:hypothetical protein